jgi:biotin carboxyl carrier protein
LTFDEFEFEDKTLQKVDLADPKFVRQNTACKLINVFVEVGAEVKMGDKMAVVEIMKLHHTLTSQGNFKVKKINFKLNERI